MNKNSISVKFFSTENYFLPEMAKSTEFKNYDQCKLAAIEVINLNTPNDERDPRHYDIDLPAAEGYPYKRTRSGFLQAHLMPWDYRSRQMEFGAAGTLTALLALACKVL